MRASASSPRTHGHRSRPRGVNFEDLKSDLFAEPLKLAGAGETGNKSALTACVRPERQRRRSNRSAAQKARTQTKNAVEEPQRRNGLPRLRGAAAAPAAAAGTLPQTTTTERLRARRPDNERLPHATEGPAARATDDERFPTKKTATRPGESRETTRSPSGSKGRRRLRFPIERCSSNIPAAVPTDAPGGAYFSMAGLPRDLRTARRRGPEKPRVGGPNSTPDDAPSAVTEPVGRARAPARRGCEGGRRA